jgi:hypothetical protein
MTSDRLDRAKSGHQRLKRNRHQDPNRRNRRQSCDPKI